MSDITYIKGVDEKTDSRADFVSYGITQCIDGKAEHINIINVHGDEKLRDALLMLLKVTERPVFRPFDFGATEERMWLNNERVPKATNLSPLTPEQEAAIEEFKNRDMGPLPGGLRGPELTPEALEAINKAIENNWEHGEGR